MEGSDNVWAIDDDASRSIINIMAMIKIPIEQNNDETPKEILKVIKKRLNTLLDSTPPKHEKLFYKREEMFGYNFWINDKHTLIDNYVR